ncbi:hypothetical protein NQ314_005661 [Rhamnusium bicolor]|uniref:Serine protease K12H4.7 n=1 Tax=Rhamnusium bicolor TaxID=1586634 RepID=A0AAV8ZEN0_9CUCU|nr:hypothetical protein NQ314_005661 [Rhamnusium bicolor]
MRYYVNDEYFNSTANNVVFLYIAGEGQASTGWMTSGAWIETAKKYGAILFQLEHRFYGQSHPFSRLELRKEKSQQQFVVETHLCNDRIGDLSTENLRYLSSEQALGDLATFITAMNKEHNFASDVKWILFGGSYAGSLAAWLRQKYPHLVQGAMSASGPLFAQLDFPEYLQVVADDLAAYSQECVNVVKEAVHQLDDLLNNSEYDNITGLFNLCDDIEENAPSPFDRANFFEIIADDFAGVAQYNKNYGRTISIDDLCDILTNESLGKEVLRLAEMNKLFSGTRCLDYKYDNTINTLKNTVITPTGNMRQWIYQTCTEYGWYQTSSQDDHVFGDYFPIDFFTSLCVDVYGPEFNETFIKEKIDHTNIFYGGYDIDVSNVVFVHGSVDPWHPMGLTETTNPDAPVIFINGTAHCANMYGISENDLPQLTEARNEINRLIGEWLEPTAGANIQLPHSLLFIISTTLVSLLFHYV